MPYIVVLVLSTLRLAYDNRIPKYQVITTSISMKTLYQRSITHPGNISSEKLSLYQRRFEEGYDLPDEEYITWLKINHPESFAEQSNDNNNNGETDSLTLADAFLRCACSFTSCYS